MDRLKELTEWIANGMDEGFDWWDESNAEPFVRVAGHLEDNGQLELDYIKDLIQQMHSAVASEYGE